MQKEEKGFQIATHLLEETSKFESYIPTFAVAAVGFAINASLNLPYSHKLIPLFIAVFFWIVTIFAGYLSARSRLKLLGIISDTVQYQKAKEDKEAELKFNPVSEEIQKEIADIDTELDFNREYFYAVQLQYGQREDVVYRTFIIGMLAFGWWWIAKIITNTA